MLKGGWGGWCGVGPRGNLKTSMDKRLEDSILIGFQNSSKINLSLSLINTKPKLSLLQIYCIKEIIRSNLNNICVKYKM